MKASKHKIAAGLMMSMAAAVASAQQDNAPQSATTLEEVVITATRRGNTDMMSTPVAVTAITAYDIERYSPNDLNDIAAMVPNLSAGTISGFNSASFAMRGVAEQTIIVYKESPVGVVIDDFVVPHVQTQNLEMFDIEQVEVLRGPHGTLFGKNTTGGVINVRTKRPDLDQASIDLRLKAGDYGKKEMQVAFNAPLTDTLAFRFAGLQQESDGYYKNGSEWGPLNVAPTTGVAGTSNRGDGRDLGGADVFSARAKLLWQPSDNFSALFQYEIIRDEGDTPPAVNESVPGYIFEGWGFAENPGDPLDNAGITNVDDRLINMSKGHRVDIDGYYLNMEWDLGNYTLFSSTGYREQESRLPNTYSGVSDIVLFDATRDDNRETFQQEVRMVSDFDGPFNFVTGAFYQTNDVEFCVVQLVGFVDLLLGDPIATGLTNLPLILCNEQEATSYAAFIDGTYTISDRMRLSAGVRYTHEEKEWTGRPRIAIQQLDGGFDPALNWETLGEPLDGADWDRFPSGVQRDDESWSEPTYRLTLDYDLTDTLFAYATYSHGFKSGGYNDQTGTVLNPVPELALQPTEPETAESFEFGLKASLLDNTMDVSATAFFVTYEDAQRSLNASFDTGQETLFFNAAELEVQGIELEMNWLVMEGLVVRGNASFQDAEFNEFAADTNFDGIIDVDLSGEAPVRAPDKMATLGATYTHSVPGGMLSWNARVSYEDESIAQYSDVGPQYHATMNSKTLIDANITWESANEQYLVRLVGKNLNDDRYRTGSQSVANFWIFSAYGPPRYLGLEVEAKFDLW